MDHRQAFLEALAKDEDDVLTRRIYADWLDENDEPEEADRMRKWPAAKAWLMKYACSLRPFTDARDRAEIYREFLNLIVCYQQLHSEGTSVSGWYDLQDADQLLYNLNIVTGDAYDYDSFTFSCSC